MSTMGGARLILLLSGVTSVAPVILHGNLYFSANEGKIHLVDGAAAAFEGSLPDRLHLVDTGNPAGTISVEVANSVIGPPSSLAYSSRSGWILVSDSVKLADGKVVPARHVTCVPFDGRAFGAVQRVQVGFQPSGVDLDDSGSAALVADRMGGSVSVLRLRSDKWEVSQTLTLVDPGDEITDVTITSDDRHAVYVVRKNGKLGLLTRDAADGTWRNTAVDVFLDGHPYRVVCSPDGSSAFVNLAARESDGNGILAEVRLAGQAMEVVACHDLGFPNPETVEISGCGKWLAVPLMAGSNLPESAAGFSRTGRVVLLRTGAGVDRFQVLECGAIPEGAAFSADALELVVQCHPARELWVYRRADADAEFKLSQKIATSGFPSALIPVH